MMQGRQLPQNSPSLLKGGGEFPLSNEKKSEELRASVGLHGVRAMTKQARFGFTLASEELRASVGLHGVRAMTKQARFGFTLIELLVVIGIIGILTSVVMVSMDGARMSGRDGKRVGDIKQIQLALELYYDANSSYPTTLGALAPTYMPVVPHDPDGSNYLYAAMPPTVGVLCHSYHVGATLEKASHTSLNDDVDASIGTVCSGTDFSGVDTSTVGVFDFIP